MSAGKHIAVSAVAIVVLLCGSFILSGDDNHVHDHITVFDCDPGIDDALALMTAAYSVGEPDMYIATGANLPLEPVSYNLFLLKEHLGLEGTIAMGSGDRSDAFTPDYDGFHGEDGLGNTAARMAEENGVSREDFECDIVGIQAICEELSKYKSVTYVSTSSLLTLCWMLQNDPSLAGRIDHLYCMGGGFECTNSPGESEFNFHSNPGAVRYVLSSGIDTTLFTLDFCYRYPVPADLFEEIVESGNEPLFAEMMGFFLKSFALYEGGDDLVIFDQLTYICSTDPLSYTYKDTRITVDDMGHIEEDESGYPVKIATSMDYDYYLSIIRGCFGLD